MFDIRSLFVVMVATNLVLALSLWIGTGRRLQGGLGAVDAFAPRAGRSPSSCSPCAARFPTGPRSWWPTGWSGMSFSLIAAAILAFRGRALPAFAHAATGGVAAFAVGALLHDLGARLIAANSSSPPARSRCSRWRGSRSRA